MECDTSIQCFDTVSWVSERASGLQKAGRWFVGGDNLTGAFQMLQLQLSPLTTSIILSSNKIQNRDILVPAYQRADLVTKKR